MRSIFALGLLLCIVAVAIAQKDNETKGDAKLFFSTLTVYVGTSTTTSVITSTTTCTTSAGTLSTCTAGRRRRGLFYQDGDSRAPRGLFFNDEEEKGSIFLASVDEKKTADPVEEVKPSKSDVVAIPFEVQAGFSLPKQVDNTRFLLAFATSTSTVVSVSTATSKLTATCASTTGFSTCT